MPKLAIVAGGGALPGMLIRACRAEGRRIMVVGLEGQADPALLGGAPDHWLRLGAAAEAVRLARVEAIEEVVFAGKVRRPSIREIRPDWLALKVMTRAAARALGDDGLLRGVVREVEKLGIRVVAPNELVADLLAPEGAVGRLAPDRRARIDIARGFEAAKGLGRLDIGQAVVVQQGIVLGVEAIEGTDALIARAAALRREGPGGVLVKVAKPGQERRVDLPAIGVETVEAAAQAKLRGIAVEAGGALIVGRAAVAARADALGLFVVGMPAPADAAR